MVALGFEPDLAKTKSNVRDGAGGRGHMKALDVLNGDDGC